MNKYAFCHLENITNSRKEGVGITQLCRADQCLPSSGMGGRASIFDGKAYIKRNASSKAVLHI